MPDVSLDQIAQLESGNRNVANYRYDPRHTAGGYWQITDTTWRDIAPRAGIDIAAYPTAMSAPYEVQRQAAQTLKAQRGLSPWAPYNPRIAKAAGGGAQSFEEAAQGIPIKIEKGVAPPAPDFALLDTLLGGQPQGEPEDEGNALLSTLLRDGQGSPQTSGTPPAAPDTSQELPPIQRPPELFAHTDTEPLAQPQPIAPMPAQPAASGNGLLDSLFASLNPIGSARADERPKFPPEIPARNQFRAPEIPARPNASREPPVVEPGQQTPAAPGSTVGKVGEALASDAYTLLDTLLLSPIRQGAAGVEGALTGKGFTQDQAMAGASVGFTGSMGRGGLGAGPRLPRQEPPPIGRTPAEPPVVTAGPLETPAARPADPGVVGRASEAVRNFYSRPEGRKGWTEWWADRGQAAANIREQTGLARRAKAQATAALEEARKLTAPLVPEFERYIAAVHAGESPPKPAAMQLIDHIEGVGKLKADDPLLPVANQIRAIYQKTRRAIEAEVEDMTSFIDDYYRHMWKETAKGGGPLFLPGRAGSSASLKKRAIPTVSEGIEAGMTPVHLDPIENTLHYVAGMQDYLAFQRARAIGLEQGHLFTERSDGLVSINVFGHALYARPGYAQAWNAYFGRGFYDWPRGGPLYDKLMHAANTITGLKLGLSGYHAWNIAQESAVGGMANAFGMIKAGEINAGLKELGFSSLILPKVAAQLQKGKRLQEVYLEIGEAGTNFEKTLTDLYAKAGGRAVGRGLEYNSSAMPNFWQAWQRGSLRYDMAKGLRDVVKGGPAAWVPVRAVSMLGREMGRAMQTVMAPLFDTMIPKIKFAAWADEMEAFLRARPDSTGEEQLAWSRKLVDTMDDRFGEMVQDNLFWNRMGRQIANLFAVSVSWEYGSARAFGGAVKDIAQGKLMSPRARWLYSFPIIMGISSAAYQYFKTGKTPGQDTGGALSPGGALDLAFPRTGGTTPEGAHERALLPGYEKDAVHVWDDIMKPAMEGDVLGSHGAVHGTGAMLAGKASPGWQLAWEVLSGKDYFGNEIRDYGKAVVGAMTPIPFSQERLKGTNIGQAERITGSRPAPARHEDPLRFATSEYRKHRGELVKEYKGLYAHGVRTTEERRELDKRGKALLSEMNALDAKFRQTQIEAKAQRYRYFPPATNREAPAASQ